MPSIWSQDVPRGDRDACKIVIHFHSWGEVQFCLVKDPKLFLIIHLYFITLGISEDLTSE